jgi:CDGSH iron-sulfur domain-containing protein 3
MEKGKIAGKVPKLVALEKDKMYAWCACGKSSNQPFCDGSHQGSAFAPKVFKADEIKTVAFCMCKQTSTPPFCDGTHAKL